MPYEENINYLNYPRHLVDQYDRYRNQGCEHEEAVSLIKAFGGDL